MTHRLTIVCDYASADANGKLNLVGCFTTVRFASLPDSVRFFAVTSLQGTLEDVGAKIELVLTVTSPSGEDIARLSGVVTLASSPDLAKQAEQGMPMDANIMIDVSGLQLKEYGRHVVKFDLGTYGIQETWFHVVRPTL